MSTGKGYKQAKAQLGVRKVRPWKWMPFSNPARKDAAVFNHWRRTADEGKEYPFAKFNKVIYSSHSKPINSSHHIHIYQLMLFLID